MYKPHNHKNPSTFIQTLINSLSQALVIYYPLAGRLSWIKGSRWELHCNAKGAQFLQAKCEEQVSLDDLGDFAPTHLVSPLIPNIDYDVPIEEIPLLAVQLTKFCCGGFTLGVAFCRAVIDGPASMRFMNTWAKLARGKGLDPMIDMPCHDRNRLDSRKLNHSELTSHAGQHREFHTPPAWVGGFRETRAVVALVKLTREQVVKLKMKASSSNAASTKQKAYSSFEVVAGYVWKCVSKARYAGNGEQPTRLSTLVNCRNRLRPPLPDGYAGNTAFPTVTPTSSFHDIIHMPLSYVVENVREALEMVNEEFVGSSLDYIAREKDIESVRYNFHYPAPSVHKGPSKGNPNLFVVSWMNFSFKDADFGWGEPIYFGPGYLDSEGKAFLLNDADGNGLVVAICLDMSHVDAFRKLFYDGIEDVFPSSKL